MPYYVSMPKKVLNVTDIATELGVSRQALYQRKGFGRLPPADYETGSGTPLWERSTLVRFGTIVLCCQRDCDAAATLWIPFEDGINPEGPGSKVPVCEKHKETATVIFPTVPMYPDSEVLDTPLRQDSGS